ncbi:hypothetical protein D3C81_462270 [compost metagenome]
MRGVGCQRRSDFKSCPCGRSRGRNAAIGLGHRHRRTSRLRHGTCLTPLRGMFANQRGSLGRIHCGQCAIARHAQHRALLEQVDVASDEGFGVGTQQRDHRPVATDLIATGQRTGNLRKGLPALHGHAAVCGQCWRCWCWCWCWCWRRCRSAWTRCSRCGCRRGWCWLGCSCSCSCSGGRRIADDGVRQHAGRRDDLRFGHGQCTGRCIDQRRVLTHQPPLAPIGLDQEAQRRCFHRRLRGHPHHRPALCVAGQLELQFADQAYRTLQANALEGDRRGEGDAQVLEFGRIGRDHRDLGQQRLSRLGQDPDVAQTQGHGRTADQGQQRGGETGERTPCALGSFIHGRHYKACGPRSAPTAEAACGSAGRWPAGTGMHRQGNAGQWPALRSGNCGDQRFSAATSSASCTALRAAPLRTLSDTIHRFRPRGCDRSSRMRPTYTASVPEAWVTGVG